MENRLLAVAAVAEVLTGLDVIVCPSIVVKLLFAADIADIAVITSRLAGLALVSLGVACWPCGSASTTLYGMLTYSSLATLALLTSMSAANGKALRSGRKLCYMQS